MEKIIPMIKKGTVKAMMKDALIALRKFEMTGDRDNFKKWLDRWKKELGVVKSAEGGSRDDSLDEGIE